MTNENSQIYTLHDLKKLTPKYVLLPIISQSLAEKTETLVFDQEEEHLSVLTTNNNPQLFHQILDKLQAQGYTYTAYYTDQDAFAYALTWYTTLEKKQAQAQEEESYKTHAVWDDAVALIKEAYAHVQEYSEWAFISEIIRLAYQSGASDVHFQAEEVGVVMRLRIDGVLQSVIVFEHVAFKKYLMKLKYRSGLKMNIDQKAQDGRFDFDIKRDGTILKIDVRVSVMPWLRGESIVMRFLDASKGIMNFEELWCEPYHAQQLLRELERKYGLILITWPTWSWKTTTVYSLLNYLNSPDKKIITLEDPVEYEMPGIEQSQIHEESGYTFEEWLKWVLRHDPDIIMVWEIRSLETAEMAVNAALTWHLVISTLHTNSAVEAITRLLNMWIKPYMLASSLNAIIWQRLLRKIAQPRSLPAPSYVDSDITTLKKKLEEWYPNQVCNYTGSVYEPDKRYARSGWWYAWRVAVYEILQVDEALKQLILSHASTLDIFAYALEHGFLTMKENAYIKMTEKVTSLEEIERIL